MAKRGETKPFKVLYSWDTGIRGTVACGSLDEAEQKAAEIRRNGEYREDASVVVEIAHRPSN